METLNRYLKIREAELLEIINDEEVSEHERDDALAELCAVQSALLEVA